MGFLLKHFKFYILVTVGLLVSEIVAVVVLAIILLSASGGTSQPRDLSPLVDTFLLLIWWVGLFMPIPIFFRISWNRIGLKDTIKLFTIYLVLGFLFAMGQLVGMKDAWVVILLALIIVPIEYYFLTKY